VLPRLNRAAADVTVVDVGCSIGTMSIECAARGFRTYGVDFDRAALEIARELAAEEGVSPEFHLGDVAEWSASFGRPIDIALCFDIFEHLHDDELGSLLQSLRRQLSPEGALIFYTFPLQYDYVFYSRGPLHWPLVPFKWLSPERFERVTRAYASLLDTGLLLATGKTYKERIKKLSHCNPTTKARLGDILQRAGFTIACLESTQLYPFGIRTQRRFANHAIAHRNVYGVAYP
jgi:SAM-dependent methyltransferase